MPLNSTAALDPLSNYTVYPHGHYRAGCKNVLMVVVIPGPSFFALDDLKVLYRSTGLFVIFISNV